MEMQADQPAMGSAARQNNSATNDKHVAYLIRATQFSKLDDSLSRFDGVSRPGRLREPSYIEQLRRPAYRIWATCGIDSNSVETELVMIVGEQRDPGRGVWANRDVL